jgi:hypothetical protein
VRDKIGRNDPCWCGSGLKYKNCHLTRDRQEPLKSWETDRAISRAFNTKECLVPESMKADCSKTFIKAHTVPKLSLKQIARDGHVYSFIPSLGNLNRDGGRLRPRLLGINEASTFTGFCSYHDNAIFSKIERQPFTASQEQCFLLAYRATMREIHTKKALASLSDLMHQADRGKPLQQQRVIQFINAAANTGISAALHDNDYYKSMYDKTLLSGDFSSVRAFILELSSPPPIMCSGGILPEQDFEGNQLQDIADLKVTPHLFNVTSFYGGHYGVIAFTWLSDSDATCFPFINSLRSLPLGRITDGLIRFFFEFSENLHIQPDWWENLSESKRTALVNRLADAVRLPRKPGCINEDGINYDNWPILSLISVGF